MNQTSSGYKCPYYDKVTSTCIHRYCKDCPYNIRFIRLNKICRWMLCIASIVFIAATYCLYKP